MSLQYISIIDLIDDCLQLTGSSYDIWVASGLVEADGGYVSDTSFANRTSVFTELFWTNNIERMSALDILTNILKSFNCYLHWLNGTWRIQHYMSLHKTVTYVIYTAGVSYGYSDTGTPQVSSHIPMDIFSPSSGLFRQEGNTQRLTVIPGLRELDIKKEYFQYYSLFAMGMEDMSTTNSEPITLNIRRKWWGYVNTSPSVTYPPAKIGKRWKNIENSVYRSGYDITTHSLELNGLSIRFNVTANSDTELVIQWKFGIGGAFDLPFIGGLYTNMELTFHWFLATYDPTAGNRDYIVFTPDSSGSETGTWAVVNDGDPTSDYNTFQITVWIPISGPILGSLRFHWEKLVVSWTVPVTLRILI